MVQANIAAKLGATPGKLIAVAVLGVIFIGVLIVQFRPQAAVPARKKPSISHASNKPNTANDRPATVVDRFKVDSAMRIWPEVDLEETKEFDPFAVPPFLTQSTEQPGEPATVSDDLRKRREEILLELRKARVKVIVGTGDKTVALIGKWRLKVGDVIEGMRVAEIGRGGIVLEEAGESE